MKKKLLLLALLFVMTFLSVSCGSGSDREAAYGTSDRTAGAYDGLLRVGIDKEFPPFTYMNDAGEYTGFDIDLAREVCRRMNYAVVITPIDWGAKEEILAGGDIDCIWSAFTIKGREETYLFTEPYLKSGQCYLTRADSEIYEEDDLEGGSIAFQIGTTQQDYMIAEKYDLLSSMEEVYELNSNDMVVSYVEYGVVDAAVVDVCSAMFQSRLHPKDYRVLDRWITEDTIGVGFRREDTELRNRVQEALAQMQTDGSFQELARKWELEEYLMD